MKHTQLDKSKQLKQNNTTDLVTPYDVETGTQTTWNEAGLCYRSREHVFTRFMQACVLELITDIVNIVSASELQMEWQPNENKVVLIILSFLCNQLKVAELPTSYAQLLITTAGPHSDWLNDVSTGTRSKAYCTFTNRNLHWNLTTRWIQ